jgi:hypothetical protein
VFAIASNSRAAIGAMATGVIVWVTIRFMDKEELAKSFSTKILRSAAIITLLTLVAYHLGLFDELVAKFVYRIDSEDISSNRFERWQIAAELISWNGAGRDIFDMYGFSDVHNNYINQALVFGWILAVHYFVWLLSMTIRITIKPSLRRTPEASFCLYCTVWFLFYSLFETAGAILPVWLAFFYFGAAISSHLTIYTTREHSHIYHQPYYKRS